MIKEDFHLELISNEKSSQVVELRYHFEPDTLQAYLFSNDRECDLSVCIAIKKTLCSRTVKEKQ